MHAESFKTLQDRLTAQGNQSGGTAACSSSGINLRGLGANEARAVEKLKTISEVQQDIMIKPWPATWCAMRCSPIRTQSRRLWCRAAPWAITTPPRLAVSIHPSKTWWIGQIANMLDKMSKIPDGSSGSLLDNTIVLLVSELGDRPCTITGECLLYWQAARTPALRATARWISAPPTAAKALTTATY